MTFQTQRKGVQVGPDSAQTPIATSPAKSPSFFDSFIDTISGAAQRAVSAPAGVPAPTDVSTTPAGQEQAMRKAAQDHLSALQSALPMMALGKSHNPVANALNSVLDNTVGKVAHVSSDLLLNVAKFANDHVIKPITTTISAAAILADTKSPLYKDGFQFSDITKAWDRGHIVSPFQAIASNSLYGNSVFGLTSQPISNIFHGPDFSKVNVLSDKSIKENYVDNTFGKIFTGLGDTEIQGLAFGGIGKATEAANNAFRVAAGKAAKNAPLTDILKVAAKDGTDGIDHIQSGGTLGRPTNFGKELVDMANTSSPAQVYETFKRYSNNRLLDPFVAKETDPKKIMDIILADNGDIEAQARVYEHSRLTTYSAMGGADAVKSKIFISNNAWLPEGDVLDNIRSVHIDSVKTVPEHQQFWDMFHDPKLDKQQIWGTGNFPAEGPLARAAYDASGWVERQIGGHNNVVTRMISLAGSRMPNWHISFSNTKPYQALSEIEASFKSVPLFRNPEDIIQTQTGPITVKEYVDNVKSRYLQAPNDIEKYNTLSDVNDNIGIHMAMTGGFYKQGATEQIIKDLQSRMVKGDSSIKEKGYGMSLQGDMVEVDPQTQAQLASSIRLLPWDRIWKELQYQQANLARRGVLKTEDFLHDAFQTLSGYMSLDILGKPGYIWKQSELEPAIGAVIALGPRYLSENLPSGISNFFTNNTNRISDLIAKTGRYTSGEQKAIVNKIATLSKEFDDILLAHNHLQDEFDAFFVRKTKTDKTVDIYGPEVRQAYKDSAKLVKTAEDEYRAATRQWGEIPEIPSPASLQHRIDFLKNNPTLLGTNRDTLTQAEFALRKAKESYSLFSSGESVIAANRAIAESYKKIDDILANLSEAQKERAGILGRTLSNKQRLSGRKDTYRMIGGKWMRMPEVFDQNAVGEALKAEVSNAPTTAMTYGNEYVAQTRAGIHRRHNPTTVTDINDPHYYNELSTLMNKFYRQEPLAGQILAGKEMNELLKWGESNQGQRYMSQFGSENDPASRIRDMYATINRYLPNPDVQKMLLDHEILAPELEKGLAPYLKELVPIHPRDFDYGKVNSGLGNKYSNSISNVVNQISNNVFTKLMTPENPLRYSFIRTKAFDISARKADLLIAQGKEVTMADLEALRQSSFIQAENEMRKIFYTVPQPNRLIYSTRLVTMFPTATFNAFYRYGRMAVKYPIRTLGFLHSYNSMFTSFGVDKNGNPVTDVRDAQWLRVPMTAELGMFGGQGIRVPTRSVGFILNSPSLSPYATVPISALVQHMPNADGVLKNLLGSNYDILFPYGTNATDVKTVTTPAWLRDGFSWFRSPLAKASYLNSVKSLFDYHQVKVSMGIEKTMPTLDQIYAEANNLFQLKAAYEFAGPTPVKIDTSPMSVYQKLYYTLETKYKAQGMDAVASADAAGKEFLATVGPKFPLDQITFTGSNTRANIAKTQEGYARVYKNNVDLTKQLVHLNPKDPFVVSLLTMDMDVTDANRSAVIVQKLGQPNATLPDVSGTIPLNGARLDPAQIQEKRLNQRTWDKFFAMKANLDTIAQQYKGRNGQPYKNMDSVPALRTALKGWAENTLGKENPTWLTQDYETKANEDKAFTYASGLNLIVDNAKFMNKNGKIPFWKDASEFNKFRNIFVTLVDTAPNQKTATAYKNAYTANLFGDETVSPPIQSQMSKYDPKLQRLITMYFSKDALTKVGN